MWRDRDVARIKKSEWHATHPKQLDWAVKVDGQIVARFRDERDARGFAAARYGDLATVGKRLRRVRKNQVRRR